ncbi:hypothetical protein UMZ34_10480 [Halopseudomonas pachastrellae]|nr:hypothetical protein UMZ34_10480 [Halopseudomonas pachastrellae]
MGDALLQLDYNPLPSVIVVTPKSIEGGAAALEPCVIAGGAGRGRSGADRSALG